jgi:hypothetical protein
MPTGQTPSWPVVSVSLHHEGGGPIRVLVSPRSKRQIRPSPLAISKPGRRIILTGTRNSGGTACPLAALPSSQAERRIDEARPTAREVERRRRSPGPGTSPPSPAPCASTIRTRAGCRGPGPRVRIAVNPLRARGRTRPGGCRAGGGEVARFPLPLGAITLRSSVLQASVGGRIEDGGGSAWRIGRPRHGPSRGLEFHATARDRPPG